MKKAQHNTCLVPTSREDHKPLEHLPQLAKFSFPTRITLLHKAPVARNPQLQPGGESQSYKQE